MERVRSRASRSGAREAAARWLQACPDSSRAWRAAPISPSSSPTAPPPAEIALQIGPDARQIGEIAGLAVALVEACENSHDLGVALRRHHRQFGAESLCVERHSLASHRGEITFDGRSPKLRRHIPARILDQGNKIVSPRSAYRVLKVDQSHARRVLTLRQPEKILRMIVAVHKTGGR